MKQPTFRTKLNQYYDNTDRYLDRLAEKQVELAIIDREIEIRMKALGVDRWEDRTDMVFDIIDNEEEAREKGKTPVRKVFYRYQDIDFDKETGHGTGSEIWIEYTEDDYKVLSRNRFLMQSAFKITANDNLKAEQAIEDRFGDSAELITADCLSLIHSLKKSDCDDFFKRTRRYIKERTDDKELQRYLLDLFCKDHKSAVVESNFINSVVEPFTEVLREIRQKEYREREEGPQNDFFDYVFADARIITAEIQKVLSAWYTPAEVGDYIRQHNKLARTKEINALQTMNFSRDYKELRQRSTAGGGILAERVFENNGVEVVASRLENISLSTNTRQVLDVFLSRGIEQITHHGGKDLNRLDKQRAVEMTLDEVATVFSIDRKEARKRLNDFYDETRDFKIRIHYVVKDGKGKYKEYVATVNIFDADVQEIDQEEKNATAKPEDLDEGVQISFYNTGTLYHYNPKTAPKSTKAVKRGRLTMQFSMEFAKHLAQASIVKHNPKGYLINRRKYTSAYSVQCTLENHYNMNRGKSNAGIISLGTLLKDCYEIPTYETVMNGNRNITARIKKPLLSNIKALKAGDVLQDFNYYNPEKKEVSEANLLSFSYEDFIKSTLHFTLAPIEE